MPLALVDSLIARWPTRQVATRYYPSVQGFRGFSALSVLIEHIYRMAQHGGVAPVVSRATDLVLLTFGNAVALFFIISGFVIPASLIRHGDLRRFLIDRLLRILPVFVAIHLLVFTVGPLVGYKWFAGADLGQYVTLFVSNLTFTAPLLHLPVVQQNSWTLTYEWLFYLFVAIFWFAGTKVRHPAPVLAVLTVIGALVCVWYPICWYFLVGLAFAQVRDIPVRVSRTVEIVVVPLTLVAYYGLATYADDYSAIPLGAVIFWFVLQDGTLTSKALRSRVMQFVGVISYSLYLVHPIVMYPLEVIGGRLVRHGVSPDLVFPAFAVASIVVAVAAAYVSYRVLEVEARRRLAIWVNRHSRGPVAVSGSRVSLP